MNPQADESDIIACGLTLQRPVATQSPSAKVDLYARR